MQQTIRVKEYLRGSYQPKGVTRVDLERKEMEAARSRVEKHAADGSQLMKELKKTVQSMKLSEDFLDVGQVEEASASFLDDNSK